MSTKSLLFWMSIFAIGFAFIESSVVIYLRGIYYPEGFSFPLRPISSHHIAVEIARESATILVLGVVSILAGKSRWERFAFFMYGFGMWDIFYYVWLKIVANWPGSILEWDVLFLIPVPWVGPVLAPSIVAVLLIIGGCMVLKRLETTKEFKPGITAWSFSAIGAGLIIYTFVKNLALRYKLPVEYEWEIFSVGVLFVIVAMFSAFSPAQKSK